MFANNSYGISADSNAKPSRRGTPPAYEVRSYDFPTWWVVVKTLKMAEKVQALANDLGFPAYIDPRWRL